MTCCKWYGVRLKNESVVKSERGHLVNISISVSSPLAFAAAELQSQQTSEIQNFIRTCKLKVGTFMNGTLIVCLQKKMSRQHWLFQRLSSSHSQYQYFKLIHPRFLGNEFFSSQIFLFATVVWDYVEIIFRNFKF